MASSDHYGTIVVANLKGGTGKTTTSVYLAAGLQRVSGRTLLVDADPQGSALAWSTLVDGWPVTTVAMPQPVLHRQLPQLRRDYAHVVIDCPPQQEPIVRSAAMVADLVVMPMAPTMMDLQRLRPTLELLAALAPQDPPCRALLTRVRPRTRMSAAARTWLQDLGVPVFDAEIPLREVFARALGELPADGTEYEAVLMELNRHGDAEARRDGGEEVQTDAGTEVQRCGGTEVRRAVHG